MTKDNDINNFKNSINDEEEQDSENLGTSLEQDTFDTSEEISKKERFIYINFDKNFLRFLENFVSCQCEKEQQKAKLKKWFFWIMVVLFIVIMCLPIIALIIYAFGKISDTTAIAFLISASIELVSAMIILPKIIAEYLFNKEEDAHMLEIIKSMQEYNEKKHEHLA